MNCWLIWYVNYVQLQFHCLSATPTPALLYTRNAGFHFRPKWFYSFKLTRIISYQVDSKWSSNFLRNNLEKRVLSWCFDQTILMRHSNTSFPPILHAWIILTIRPTSSLKYYMMCTQVICKISGWNFDQYFIDSYYVIAFYSSKNALQFYPSYYFNETAVLS